MLKLVTAGESHGKALIAILEGLPAGLKVDEKVVDNDLKRRQQGYGRGKRMQIENDTAQIVSGLKGGITLASPITLLIKNKDSSIDRLHKVIAPRPGHADLAGLLKYGFTDVRSVLERASARSTAATVAAGAVCKIFLGEFGIKISSLVLSVGGAKASESIKDKIDEAIQNKDTIGGIFEVRIMGVPPGLGSYVQWDRRLDGLLTGALMSIPGVKGVEIGLGFGYCDKFGSQVHDAIYFNKNKGYFRKTNNAGGIEGGISNGQDIILRACMKPISTLMNPLASVNIETGKGAKAATERSDTCVVEASSVVAESVCAYILTDMFLDKFGSDYLFDIKTNFKSYIKRIHYK